jgi:DNA-directed RNA polymerase specialized sigma24 family protein
MEDELDAVVEITEAINRIQSELSALRDDRKTLMIKLRSDKVTARKLSDLLGMSEQNVHKIVKGK